MIRHRLGAVLLLALPVANCLAGDPNGGKDGQLAWWFSQAHEAVDKLPENLTSRIKRHLSLRS